MLTKLTLLNDKMGQLNLSGSAQLHTQTRHKDILQSYRVEFNKITQNNSLKLEREELLRGSGIASTSSASSLSRRDLYLKENQHISK
jgi:golgi SNAP receptor complex member 1